MNLLIKIEVVFFSTSYSVLLIEINTSFVRRRWISRQKSKISISIYKFS